MKKTITALTLLTTFSAFAQTATPNLVLQITVDGLRGDLLERYAHNFSDNGFNYLLKQGTVYKNAHYQHANTETIVGHASLATGTTPAVHGMVGNVWFDRADGRLVYNIEDSEYSILTENADVDKDTEVDQTMALAQSSGRTPNNFLVSTFSDELTLATNGLSKVFSVSVKDRGAVSMAGKTGKAFWFSKSAGTFVTSDYYYDSYPDWVTKWNEGEHVSAFSGKSWDRVLPIDSYTLPDSNSEQKTSLATFKRSFPYPYGPASYPYFNTMLTLGPAGDALTANFASELLSQERLGKGDATDYLSISFSSNDYVIHINGPSSHEAEDNLIRLDQLLADLFQHVDKHVGLDKTLIVLSSDHGVPEVSPYSQQLGLRQVGYVSADDLFAEDLDKKLNDEFNASREQLISQYFHPYIYLDHDFIKKNKLDIAKVQRFIAQQLDSNDKVYRAITAVDITENSLASDYIAKRVINNFNPSRSGDIHITFEPRSYINSDDGLVIASMHGSPWRYDTHVPIIFAGMNIKPRNVYREVTPYDVAPTLSALLSIPFPSGSTGNVLEEVFVD